MAALLQMLGRPLYFSHVVYFFLYLFFGHILSEVPKPISSKLSHMIGFKRNMTYLVLAFVDI